MTDQPYPPLRPQMPVRRRRQPTAWPMLVGIVVLALLVVGVLILLLLSGGEDPPAGATSPGTTASSTVSSSLGSTTSAAATPSGSASAGGSALAPDTVVSLSVDALALRDAPGLGGEIRWRLPAGTVAFVLAGPTDADGIGWYQVSGMGLPYASGCVTPEPGALLECPAFLGWVAGAGADGTAYLEPAAAPECPEPPPTIVSLSEQAYTLRLICFDDEPLTFLAWWPEQPDDAGPGDGCPAVDTEVGWIVCQDINDRSLAASPDDPAGRLAVSIDPATGLSMPPRGQWVEVTGHFDDPTARRCGEVAELMETDAAELNFNCRLQFVLSAVAPAAGA